MERRDVQQLINAIHWYHEFDFGNGIRSEVKTPDAASHRALWRFIQSELDTIDFAGKTVLDIGCWDGFWSFYAEGRHAAHVLATDDSSQNWAGTDGFKTAHRLLGSKVEADLHRSVYDLAALGRFDVVLCLGVYYHLLDPFFAFSQLRHCCHENSVAVFEGDVLVGPKLAPDQSVSLHSPDVRKAPRFVPDLNTLRFFLDATYFTRISEVYLDLNTMHKASAPPEGVNRVLMICKPSVGIRNPCHVYKPPFGLHEYDIRRAKPANEWSELG